MDFKVGDILVGLKNVYTHTSEGRKVEVVWRGKEDIMVTVLPGQGVDYKQLGPWRVKPEAFALLKPGVVKLPRFVRAIVIDAVGTVPRLKHGQVVVLDLDTVEGAESDLALVYGPGLMPHYFLNRFAIDPTLEIESNLEA